MIENEKEDIRSDVALTPRGTSEPPEAAAPGPPAAPCKVLVVDDELDGLTAAHFRESAGDFSAELGDLTSPTVAETWAVVVQLKGLKSLDATDPRDVEALLASDEFVQDVLLSDAFQTAGITNADKLRSFYARAEGVKALKAQLRTAYAAPQFQLVFMAARPTLPKSLLDYDLVILDLVLANSAGAVDEMVEYLSALGRQTYPIRLPAIIVLSSREEMLEQRLRFSTDSNISAAGLLLLEKRHVSLPQFGAAGLVLSYQQLDRQRDVAQHMRVFVLEWMKALDNAKKAANTTLWNLDAAALQEIHLSAFHDDDPYDEHLNELVAREYMWHVEGSTRVSNAIESMDNCFQAQFKTGNTKVVIGERFIAPFVDAKPGRDIVSHYTWTGFSPSVALNEVPAAELLTRFNRLVPFGAVLAPPALVAGTECLVHITQQCDLNSAVRVKKPGDVPESKQSAMFAIAQAVEVNDRSIPIHETHELVARGLRLNGKEFDLKLLEGRLISLEVPRLIELASKEQLRVVGRLRHDIANHFLNATANHMTRPASLKTTRVEVRPAKIFIWGKGLPNGKPLKFLDADERDERVVAVSQHNRLLFFQDDASMWLALWVIKQMASHFAKSNLDAANVCNSLRTGIRENQVVVSILKLCIASRAFTKLDTFWTERTAPDQPFLYVIHEPDT